MSHRLFSTHNPVIHCAPRRVRRSWGATLWSVLMLLALAALCGWLLSLMLDARCSMLDFRFQHPGSSNHPLVAMAPVPMGMVFGLLLSLSVMAIVMAVRKVRENDAFCEALRKKQVASKAKRLRRRREFWENGQWPHDVPAFKVEPLGSPRETESPGPCPEAERRWSVVAGGMTPEELRQVRLGLEDVREIVNACRVECREALLLVECAQRTVEQSQIDESLSLAQRKLAQVTRTLGDLQRSLTVTDAASVLRSNTAKDEQRVPTDQEAGDA